MRIELEDNTKNEAAQSAAPIQDKDSKELFNELSFKNKVVYIWDYYKWWFIGTIIAAVLVVTFVRSYRENSKPVYIDVEFLNTYLGSDLDNPLEEDFIKEAGIDTNVYNVSIGYDISLSNDVFDTTMLAYQERLVANYAAAELDVVVGPVDIMEGAANCDNYAHLDDILPQDLIDELKDREYEFYYFDPSKDEIEDYEGEDLTPYFAGIYLDDCSYLNNIGEYGAYGVAEKEEDRVIFTIAANTQHAEQAVEFLRFLIHNR